MAFSVDSAPAVGAHDEVHSSQYNALGAVRDFSDGNTYIYLKGVTNCADGSVVARIARTRTFCTSRTKR